MVRTYRIAHLERKQEDARELLARLKQKLSTECLNSVRSILIALDRALSEDGDADFSIPPTD